MNARTMNDRDRAPAADRAGARDNASRTRTDGYATLIEPTTLEIRRVLPGPVERVWAYLTDGDLRRQWLAAGTMELRVGAEFELVWRNDELTTPPGTRPDGFGAEHSMKSRITALDPPRRLAFTWGEGDVTFDLEPDGERVVLTITHTRLNDTMTPKVGPGWHAHLDVLGARLAGDTPAPFWDEWTRLKGEYAQRFAH